MLSIESRYLTFYILLNYLMIFFFFLVFNFYKDNSR